MRRLLACIRLLVSSRQHRRHSAHSRRQLLNGALSSRQHWHVDRAPLRLKHALRVPEQNCSAASPSTVN